MDIHLIDELSDCFEGEAETLLLLKSPAPEIGEAARRLRIAVRFISASEINMEKLRELSSDPWLALRRQFHIGGRIRALVVEDISQLGSAEAAIVEAMLKHDPFECVEPSQKFDFLWATCRPDENLSERLASCFGRVVSG